MCEVARVARRGGTRQSEGGREGTHRRQWRSLRVRSG
jgi:hypothetical protein